MDDVAEKIIAILRKNMRNPEKDITLDTKLSDLEIEFSILPSSFSISRILSAFKFPTTRTKKSWISRRSVPLSRGLKPF